MSWRDSAACRGMDGEIFFPIGDGPQVDAAKTVCAGCPVREDCLRWALGAMPHGIAGGMTEDERRALRRKQGVQLETGFSRIKRRAAEVAR